jgi:Zn-dependent protease
MFNLSPKMIRDAVVYLIALVLSIAVHEFGHAFMADRLGDRLPRSQGRVTLNPLVHADPIGTFLFPIIAMFSGSTILFGWGRPVQINPVAFTRKLRMKTSHMLVALAGPAMNVLLALVVSILLAILLKLHVLSLQLANGIAQVIELNWILAFFNLIPCPPLDGGAVLAGLLPDRHRHVIQFLEQYGFIILLGLLISGATRFLLIPADFIAQSSINLIYRLVF